MEQLCHQHRNKTPRLYWHDPSLLFFSFRFTDFVMSCSVGLVEAYVHLNAGYYSLCTGRICCPLGGLECLKEASEIAVLDLRPKRHKVGLDVFYFAINVKAAATSLLMLVLPLEIGMMLSPHVLSRRHYKDRRLYLI